MKKIAITGTIGSGKTTCYKYISQQGYPTFDADAYGKQLLQIGTTTYDEIIAVFGVDILDDDANIVNQRVSDIIFNDESMRQKLNHIIHPQVKVGLLQFFSEYKDEICFAEIPLLYEVGWETLFDEVIVVTCEEEFAIERCMKSRNYTREEAISRIRSQVSAKLQVNKADKVFYNNGTKEEFLEEIHQYLLTLESEVTDGIKEY